MITELVRTGHGGRAEPVRSKTKTKGPQGGRATAKQKTSLQLLRASFLID
jgi:hypothetical protein